MARTLEVNAMVRRHELWDVFSHVIHFGKGLEERDELEEAAVFRVVIPREDGDRIFLVESVASW
jgi:hypothetical protein